MRRSTISSASSGLEYLSSNVDQTDRTRWAEARRAELYSCSDIDVEGTDDADDEGGWTRRRFCGDLSIEIIFGARSFEDAQSEGNWEMVEPRSCLKVYAVVHTSRHRYRCWFVQVASLPVSSPLGSDFAGVNPLVLTRFGTSPRQRV